ncbi:MAG: hypothetical protein SOT81_10200 [Treponema sp.]|nr:hypothetical protein [Treponema sp.]
MRKLAGLFFLCGLLFSCQNFTEHDVKITNSSSVEVTFSLERYGRGSYTLASGDSLTRLTSSTIRRSFLKVIRGSATRAGIL